MLTVILIITIVIIIFLIWMKTSKKQYNENSKNIENLSNIETENVPIIKPNPMAPKVNPNFIEAKFHSDYMDVINAFNDISPNQRQIFNINNVPCKVTHETDIAIVGKIVSDFVSSINDDIKTNVPLVHTVNSGWDEVLPENNVKSGWEKVQESLGLPASLYNKPKLNTKVRLVQFSDVTKYETENEIKYECKIVISKDNVKDKLVIKVSFVHPKSLVGDDTNIILETISVLGYLTNQGLGTDRIEMDNFYQFDSLEKNNMITGKTVATELMKKYKLRQKVMQEQIDGMDLDTQEKYAQSPSSADYDSYKLTQTIFDDMNGNKTFD